MAKKIDPIATKKWLRALEKKRSGLREAKNLDSPDDPVNSLPLPDADEQMIIEESAHIPDRDQSFGRGHQVPHGEIASDADDSWYGKRGEGVKGDRDAEGDAVDELLHVTEITESSGDTFEPEGELFFAGKDVEEDSYDLMGDEELYNYAEVLGIPGRDSMSRHELIQIIRAYDEAG